MMRLSLRNFQGMQQRCNTKLHQEKVALQGFLGEEALSAHCPQSSDVIKCNEKVVETRNFGSEIYLRSLFLGKC
jgi:hypothetical protein